MGGPAQHRPVLFAEALEGLAVVPDGLYVDGTFGRGGHSGAILQRLGGEGRLLAIDKDPEAVAYAEERFAGDHRFVIRQGSFAQLGMLLDELGWNGRVAGILLDLGVSSPQLDQNARGFSFMSDGPLDMRMDNRQGVSAADWLAQAEAAEIAHVLRAYGEERFSRRIAAAIVREREEAPILGTARLAQIISAAVPVREKGKHPATRSFQAIRIYINRELDDLQACLPQTVPALAAGGRLAVISFHSLEDRIVKRFIRDASRGDHFPAGVPVTQDRLRPRLKRIGGAIRPSPQEVDENPRSRSAVLRLAQRL
jgi:16S rRNA (cytosine1402-N4)-methyltransferase